MSEMSVMLVTMDFRHLPTSSYFTYGYDWAISITALTDMNGNEASTPSYLPEMLLSTSTSKSDTIQLALQSYVAQSVRIDILLYSGYLLAHKTLFGNSTVAQYAVANRALYGTTKSFVVVLTSSLSVALPMNLPIIDTYTTYPTMLINDVSTSSTRVKHSSVSGKTIFSPSSLYWGSNSAVNLPYLPYFSNCQGYGEAIHFWEIFELAPECVLVPYNETVPIHQYSFGSYPKADTCSGISINCIYDEVFSDQQSSSRWFEVGASTMIMQMSKEPMDASELSSSVLSTTEVISVTLAQTQAGGRVVPSTVHLTFQYFQRTSSRKSLVKATVEFDSYKTLNDAEYNGGTQVAYTLLIDYLPMSHTELMINFALEYHFYIILYILVGFAAVLITAIFTIYHRLVTNATDIPAFKFWSYLKFNMPPALYGMALALLPVTAVIFLIASLISGHLSSYNVWAYPCSGSDPSICQLTIFDNIPVCVFRITVLPL